MKTSKKIKNIIVTTVILVSGLISLISLMVFFGNHQTGLDAVGSYLMAAALTGLLFIKMYDLYKELTTNNDSDENFFEHDGAENFFTK
ncbi:hypothetical protein NLY09_08995 (plasmid) [Burkholderia vietnamiensis]